MSKLNIVNNSERDQNNESFTNRLEDTDEFQNSGDDKKKIQEEQDGNNNKRERGQTHDQFHTNKSSQIINHNHSYMSGSDKQFLSSQQNTQYYDKHDYNADHQPPVMKKNVVEAYTRLHDYVSDIHDQITEKMKKSEEDFLYVYKEQMYTIQKELKALKKKMDDELLKQKSNDKMNILTEERDYFKAEALRLDRTCKEQEREIEELQFKQKVLTEDKNYYEGFVIETKKENKALKSELLQLYKFKAAENQQTQKQQLNQQHTNNFQPQQTTTSQMIQTGQVETTGLENENMSDFRPHTSQNQRGEEIFLSEVKYNLSARGLKNTTIPNTTVSSNQQSQQNFFGTQRAQTHHSKRSKMNELNSGGSEQGFKFEKFSSSIQNSQVEELLQEIQSLKANEEKYIETIKQLRIFLEKEKTNAKKNKANLYQTYQQRSDLEQILLECINETKKDIQRRRAMQKALSYQQHILLKKRDQIALQNNNMKRSLSSLKAQIQILPDEDIPFNQFNSKDKMKTLKQFISSDKFLDQIYQITFGHSKIPKFEKEKLLIETELDPSSQTKEKNKFQLTESWKQDAQYASQVFQNFKGFRYSFKPQTASGSKSVVSRELKSSLFNFTDKTGKSINLIQQIQIDPQQIQSPQITYKHKLYKDVCKEFHQKAHENKILIGI